MDPLATVEDMALGRELSEAETGRAERLLAQASARFRREARQRFTPGESVVRLRVDGGRYVYLPESPVVDVLSVTGEDGRALAWRRLSPTGQEIELTLGGEFVIRPGVVVEPPGGITRPRFVVVNYTHGGEVPEVVAAAVAGAVARVLNADPEAVAGATQVTDSDTRGPFSRSKQRQFAAWAVGGQVLLSPDDLALARSFRKRPPRLRVMIP